jgi:pyrimidine-nucleoside phosphorylase
MLAAGELASKKMVVVMTDMSQPLGNAIGNWLELREAIHVLSGKGPEDVQELVLVQCALMLVLGGKAPSYLVGRHMAQKHLDNGQGLQRLRLLIRAQGATEEAESYVDDPDSYPSSARTATVRAEHAGWVQSISALNMGLVNVLLGGGRVHKASKIDPKAGILLHRKVGERVAAGDALATLHSDVDEQALTAAAARAFAAIQISPHPVRPPALIGHILINGTTIPWLQFVAQQEASNGQA